MFSLQVNPLGQDPRKTHAGSLAHIAQIWPGINIPASTTLNNFLRVKATACSHLFYVPLSTQPVSTSLALQIFWVRMKHLPTVSPKLKGSHMSLSGWPFRTHCPGSRGGTDAPSPLITWDTHISKCLPFSISNFQSFYSF